MGLLEEQRRILGKMIDRSYSMGQRYGELKKIKDSRRRKLINQVTLTKTQKQSIDDFYKEYYGKKINHDWHKMYQSYTGNFCYEYFPEIIFSSILEPLMNPVDYRRVLDDKLLLDLYCSEIDNVRVPKTIASYSKGSTCGIYWNEDYESISIDKLVSNISNCGKAVIKLVQDTSSGRGVSMVCFENGIDTISQKKAKDIISAYDESFIIQECIVPNEELRILYPDSINTFRVITYLWKGSIYNLPIALRMGQGGSFLDNAHAGGMFIGVSDEGFLMKEAYTEFQDRYYKHPNTNVVFENYKISFVPELIRCAKKMHLKTPQLGIISWDLTVNNAGEIVLIEVNTRGQSVWFPQMANGKSAFGSNTSEILRYIAEQKKKY